MSDSVSLAYIRITVHCHSTPRSTIACVESQPIRLTLRLNAYKTQMMWLMGFGQQLEKIGINEISTMSTLVVVLNTARDLGVIILTAV